MRRRAKAARRVDEQVFDVVYGRGTDGGTLDAAEAFRESLVEVHPGAMSHTLTWFAFVGDWLLVAGAIYQAAVGLADEEFKRADLERVASVAPTPSAVSRWWLLFPPMAYALHVRRRRARRRALMDVVSPDEIQPLLHFSEAATGWLFVASGAFLIAVNETWELREAYEWSTAVSVVLVIAMFLACAANTVVRVRRKDAILALRRD